MFIIVFNKEISAIISFFVNIILHQKKEVFLALMWVLTVISFGLCYLTFVLGFFSIAILLFVMGIIFLHLAKIDVFPDFYRRLLEEFVYTLRKIKQHLILFAKKLYYVLLNEFLYRFIQIVNVLLIVFGSYLLFSGIFDPTGSLTEIVLGINLIALFPPLNIILELLFGFSIITISIILYIITVQNKKKLVR
jgi:hypothetical protein